MKEFEIKIGDIQRILLGEVPTHFYLELIFRVAFIYFLLMVSMRFMGKRMSSQLSRNEMAAVASLAAAIGVPLMNPDRGILPAVVIALVIITLQKTIARMASKNRKFESLTQDHIDTLIEDGVMKLDIMSRTRVTRGRVLAQLRSEQVSHLGMVKRLYFEAGGKFSYLKNIEPNPGLSVLPEWDEALSEQIHEVTEVKVCSYCGNHRPLYPVDEELICINCKKSTWINAVVQVDSD